MQKTVAIIQGHPDPAGHHHLCHALADAYAEGASSSGHHVIRIEIAQIDFPILQTRTAFESGPLPASLEASRDAILAANHIVIVFPLWLGTMPAIVKAYLEQVIRPGVAFVYETRGIKKLLGGRSAHIVVTMGMPAWLYRIFLLQPRCSHTGAKHLQILRHLSGPHHDVWNGADATAGWAIDGRRSCAQGPSAPLGPSFKLAVSPRSALMQINPADDHSPKLRMRSRNEDRNDASIPRIDRRTPDAQE